MNKKQVYAGIIVMLLLCLITYSNHFNNDFHFDDSHTIQENPAIRNIHNVPLFFKDGSTVSVLPQNQTYRPLTVTSLAFDYWLGKGYNLFYFHLSTFILFLIQGVLMVFFFNGLLRMVTQDDKLSRTVALITTTWYMLHPAMAETVNYIIARSDLQSTMFFVLAFYLYICSSFCRKTFLYLVPVVIGAFAKPPIVMFAPMLFIYILLFEYHLGLADVFKAVHFKTIMQVLKKSLPAIICCVAMYLFIDKMTPKNWEPGGTSPWMYLATQPFVIFHYFQMLFAPVSLSADSDWALLQSVWDIRFFIGCSFILIMIIVIFYTSKIKKLQPISFGLIWFFITLIPTSSIIPLAEVLNDHRMFLPFVGLILSVTWAIALVLKKYKAVIAAGLPQYVQVGVAILLVMLFAFAYGTYQRNKVWHTEESLWYDVTQKSPLNGRGLMNYGLTQMAKGNYAGADTIFAKSLKLLPTYYAININEGVLKDATGDKIAAEGYFVKAIQFGPNFQDPYFFYGRFLTHVGRYQEAIVQLKKTLEISPAYLEARLLLMDVYENTGDWDELKMLAQSTLQIVPDNAIVLQYLNASVSRKGKLEILADDVKASPTADRYLDLSLQYFNAGRFAQSIDAANEAIKLKPGFPEAYNNIGSAYNSLKEYEKAIVPLQKAIELKPDFQLAKNNLAVAQKSLGLGQLLPATTTAEGYINQSLTDFNSGKYQECINACYMALKLKPGYDLAYNNMCAAYNKLGRYNEAIKAGEEGVKLNPANQLLKNNLQESYNKKKASEGK